MKIQLLTLATPALFLLASCGSANRDSAGRENPAPETEAVNTIEADPLQNKGIGPVKSITLAALDEKIAAEGQKIYQEKCSACHKPDQKYIGPAPKGILERRSPEWIMNMILNPQEMLQQDPIAKQLLAEANGAIMANQGLSEDEARKILEYFRTLQ